MRPTMDLVAAGQIVLAGVPAPIGFDPVYQPISPVMLPHWRFIAGDDRAEPLTMGAVPYVSLRVFSIEHFAFVVRCGGRLRPLPRLEDQQYRTGVAGRPTPVHLAKVQLYKRHAAGQMKAALGAECAAIVSWLEEEHPDAPKIKPKSLAEALRAEHRRLCQKP